MQRACAFVAGTLLEKGGECLCKLHGVRAITYGGIARLMFDAAMQNTPYLRQVFDDKILHVAENVVGNADGNSNVVSFRCR